MLWLLVGNCFTVVSHRLPENAWYGENPYSFLLKYLISQMFFVVCGRFSDRKPDRYSVFLVDRLLIFGKSFWQKNPSAWKRIGQGVPAIMETIRFFLWQISIFFSWFQSSFCISFFCTSCLLRIFAFENRTINYLSSTYKCNFLGADNKQ